MNISIGVDIGGSHITAMAVQLAEKKLIEQSRVSRPVDSNGEAEGILSVWTDTLRETLRLAGGHNLAGIGFAMPGPFDYPAGIARFAGVQKFDHLNGVDVRREMRRRLDLDPAVPVRFVNDATCFAIGETWMGPASNFRKVLAITLGTGFGSAFLDNGVPVETGPTVPPQGCLYHLPVGASNADDHFSTRWFVKTYLRLTGKEVKGVYDLSQMAASSPVVQSIFSEFGTQLATFLVPWLKRFDVEYLVLGGNIAQSLALFQTEFSETLAQHNMGHIGFGLTRLGEDAAIIGSARLSDNNFYHKLDLSANK